MSGTTIPYHLRQNKVIDRHAFIELLLKIDKVSSISQYTYVGFGGHSLEDFKYIHEQFDIRRMISIEESEEVFRRQKFNMPLSCIDAQNLSSSDFIQTFMPDTETIVWLDYTDPSQLATQIQEFQGVLELLDEKDIVKITLNSNPSSFAPLHEEKPETRKVKRLEILSERLGDLLPSAQVNSEMMTFKNYPKALCSILKHCSSLILEGKSNLIFQPLTAFSYADGQQMMTLTGILIDQDEVDDFLLQTGLSDWNLSSLDWQPPKKINVPDLTIRERLHINSLLPNTTVEELHQSLGFHFGDNKNMSREMLETYILFYKKSPLFSRVMV